MRADAAPRPLSDEVREKYRTGLVRFSSATGTLYEGRDPDTGRTVIVKAVDASAFTSPTDRQRVRRELQKLSQMRHPNLSNVLEFGEAGDVTWVAREFVSGETLHERIASRGRLSAPEVAWLGSRLSSALGELHKAGVLHRDLRPGHVILGADGNVALIDPAMPRSFTTPDGRLLGGTPGYIAPEVLLGKIISFRSDLYGLGAVLYEALAGVPPFLGIDPARVVHLQVEADPEPLDGAVPSGLSRLIGTLLSRDPRDRPFGAQMVERQLGPFMGSEPAPVSTTGSAEAAFDEAEGFAVEPGERTVVTASWDDAVADSLPTTIGPALSQRTAAASAPAVPPSPPGMHLGPPTRGGPKATLLGVAPDPDDVARYEGSAPRVRAVSGNVPLPENSTEPEGLDYDDVLDTNQNEASRVFGVPDASADGSAVPPLPDAVAQQVLAGQMLHEPAQQSIPPPSWPNADPQRRGSAPRPVAGTVEGSLPPPAPQPPPPPAAPPGMYGPPQGYPQPPEGAFDAPAIERTMAVDTNNPPPGWGPQGPVQQPQWGIAPQQQPPPGAWGPQQGQVPYGAPPPSMGGAYPAGQPTMAPPAPTPAKSSRGPWVVVLVVVVLLAGVGGWFAAGRRRAQPAPEPPPRTMTVVPPAQPEATPTPPTTPTEPAVPPEATADVTAVAEVDAGALAATPDVTAVAEVDAGAPPVVAAEEDAGSPVAEPPPPPEPAPTPVATPTPTPVVRPSRPRPQPVDMAPIDAAMRARNWSQARTLLQEAVRRRGSDASLHARLGDANDRLGDQTAALNEYRTATRLDRRNTNYLHRRADLQLATGDRAGAIATLREIQRIRPDDRAAAGRLQSLGQ